MILIRAAWAYRYFILSSIRNEFRARFARSKLGALWMIIHPLVQVLIFALVLSEILAAKLPGVDNKYAYSVYLLAGSLCWNLFAETTSRLTELFVSSGSLMKKISFPRICLPLITAGTTLTTNLLLMIAVFVVFGALGHVPGEYALWLPILTLLTLLFATGIGLILGVANVFVRDVGQVVPIVLQLFFWLTPIVYSLHILPANTQRFFALNPIYPLVASYQNVLLFDKAPEWRGLFVIAAVSVIMLVVGLILFRRASAEMVDVL